MRRRSLALISIAAVIAAAVGVVAVSSGSGGDESPQKRANGFKPKDIKGKWTGEWKNLNFGSKGDILANVKVKGDKLIPLVDFSGNVLGCPDPPEDSVTLKKGNGNNKWNSKAFKVKEASNAFGNDFAFSYKHENNKVKASGSSPCDPQTTFTANGKLTKKKFSMTVDISFGQGPGATAELSAKKG